MSKADQLIEAFWHKEEYLREAAMYYPAESGSRRTLLEVADLIAHFRDAVNEKPHEPPHDGDREYANAADFAKHNPLGGVALVFECMADRLRTGESLNSVLDDYGYQIKDAGAALSHRPSDGSQTSVPASPPHAAAEPEKPVAWMYEHSGSRREITKWRWVTAGDWTETPLYASPAQPIAREPTKEMTKAGTNARLTARDDASTPDVVDRIWLAMYDAARKSAEGEK